MRRGLVIGGIVLAIVGVLLIVASYAVNGSSTSNNIPSGSVLTVTPSGIGSISMSGSWSGGTANTTVYITTGTPVCPGPTGVVTSGKGASGSLSASLTPGTTYNIFACSGSSGQAITYSYTSSGITYLVVIGIVLVVIGVILAVLGLRGKPKAPKSMPAEPAAPQ
jgi:uncharacterized membrane protein